jgi:hypothetical protein
LLPAFEAQGDPFNTDFYRGDGRVLIAQLATTDGTGFTGTMTISYESGGIPGVAVGASFEHVIPGPGALALLAIAGARGRRRRR